MIKGIFHRGSGLGNMLHRFVGTKILAIKQGQEHTMIAQDLFKGTSFIKLDLKPDDTKYTIEQGSGRVIPESYECVIDGEFQAESDFIDYIPQIREWLKVQPLFIPDDLCIINFRGGEYVGVANLFLPKVYWDLAISKMLGINPNMEFEVHTDDPETAKTFFPHFRTVSDIGTNWRSIYYAKHLILSNSSFAILPAIIGKSEHVIAPMFWAGYNKGYWQMEDNKYEKFTYIHHI